MGRVGWGVMGAWTTHRWLAAGTAAIVLLAALGVLRARSAITPDPAHAAAAAIPAWLPALRGPVPPPAPEPLGADWLAMHPAPDLGIDAQGAVLVDLDTREVLWARD